MKHLSLSSRKIEILFYFLIWTLVYSVPYFSSRHAGAIDWNVLMGNWFHLSCYLILFLINVYYLVPNLLLKKRYFGFFAAIAFLILIVIAVCIYVQPFFPKNGVPGMDFPPDRPGPGLHLPDGFRPGIKGPGDKPRMMVFFDNLIICFLIVGAGTTTKLVTKWLNEEKLRKDIEKEQLTTNLALLRHQVSPHFFMNTLNNIHSLIEINSEKAQDAVVRLSTLMRYLLYDSAQNTIELKKEIEFIHSFISLMELRHSDEAKVTVKLPEQIPDIQIPPMLFISLLENAFKHGVSYPLKSYIIFELRTSENSLSCSIKNSKHKTAVNSEGDYSGIGLSNLKKSLQFLYNNDYQLDIFDKENEFEVHLTIPL